MSIALIGTLVGIAVGLITIGGFVKWLRGIGKQIGTISEGVLGEAAVKDLAGEIVKPAVPSLQARVGKIEEIVIAMSEYNNRLTAIEDWIKSHEASFTEELLQLKLLQQNHTDLS